MSEIEQRYEHYRATLAGTPFASALKFWEELSVGERQALLADLDAVDFELVKRLVESHVLRETPLEIPAELQPPDAFPAAPNMDLVGKYADAVKQGISFIRTGRVAALTVAGGQGTRLGFDGPKGAFRISPVQDKPLFQLFAEGIAGAQDRYGGRVPWYVMTSPTNDAATRAFFEEHSYFGLSPENVRFFQQGVMPAFSYRGEILLSERHRLALAPDGHGGTLRALAASGVLDELGSQGVEFISYFQVDNPLVKPVDPLFIGLTQLEGAEMACKVIPKAHDFEKVGVVAQSRGRTLVVEYSDLPDELATARDGEGRRLYDAANIGVHVFRRSFVERLTRGGDGVGLPWHRAEKKVPFIDENGELVEPDAPNAIKLETFIFDAMPLAKKVTVLETRRGEEFSPLKNATGSDSPETSRRDMIRRAADWLENSGVAVPRRADAEPDAVIEISPLLALDANHLRERLIERPVIQPGVTMYLEPERELRPQPDG